MWTSKFGELYLEARTHTLSLLALFTHSYVNPYLPLFLFFFYLCKRVLMLGLSDFQGENSGKCPGKFLLFSPLKVWPVCSNVLWWGTGSVLWCFQAWQGNLSCTVIIQDAQLQRCCNTERRAKIQNMPGIMFPIFFWELCDLIKWYYWLHYVLA